MTGEETWRRLLPGSCADFGFNCCQLSWVDGLFFCINSAKLIFEALDEPSLMMDGFPNYSCNNCCSLGFRFWRPTFA